MTARLAAIATGIWLMASPTVLDYGEPALDSDRTAGPIIACLAFVALWQVARPLRWATVPAAAWLVIAPLALGYDDAAVTANSVVCGAVTLLAAPLGGKVGAPLGGGWRALVVDGPDATRRPVRR